MSEVKKITTDDVPILDMSLWRSGDPAIQSKFVEDLKQMALEWGFLVVKNHGIESADLTSCYEGAETFFRLPLDAKSDLSYTKIDQKKFSNIGYFPFKSETAVDEKHPDLKEFFHVGPTLSASSPMQEHYAENVWPSQLPSFQKQFLNLYAQMGQCGNDLMRAFGVAFGLTEEYVQDLTSEGNSILRVLHYPPVEEEMAVPAMRAAPHTGIQLLGLQPRTTHPGLQVYSLNQGWVFPHEFGDNIIVNIGEMLAYLLGDKVTPTLHRVVNSQNGSGSHDRYAIVHFFHANSIMNLEPIDDAFPQVQVGVWLMKRLKQLGLF